MKALPAALGSSLGASLVLALLAGPAAAQTSINRAEAATTGKATRLAIAPNLKKDCSAGPMPEVRIVTTPKNGSLITRAGKVKTPATYRCPNVEAQVQGVFYQSKASYTGADEAVFDIKTADGQVERFTIKITVGAAPANDKKSPTEL
jgi:hypothetical protein